MTLQTDLEAAVAKATTDSDLLHQIVHGGDQTTVTTEGGGVKSAAKAVKELEDQFVASDVLAESTAARDKAQAWADEAEDAEVEPGRFSARHWASKAEAYSGLPEFHGLRFENGGLVWEHGTSGAWDASAYDAWGIYPAGFALAYNFVVRDLIAWVIVNTGAQASLPPDLAMGELMTVLLGMLGLGAFRTVEKFGGKAR